MRAAKIESLLENLGYSLEYDSEKTAFIAVPSSEQETGKLGGLIRDTGLDRL